MNQDTRESILLGLHEIIDFLQDHPTLEIPANLYGFSTTEPAISEHLYVDAAEAKQAIGDIARALGKCDKWANDYSFGVERTFGVVKLRYTTNKENTCEAKVVGTKRVTKQKLVTPAVYEEVEEDVDDIEWTCPDSILSGTRRQ